MKLKLKPNIDSIIRDSFSLNVYSYFLLINSNSLQFFRAVGRGKLERLFEQTGDTTDSKFLNDFLKEVTSLPDYYGQPLTILLNNSESFAYLKVLSKQNPQQVLENVRLMQNENLHFSHTVREDTKSPIFIGQGINKSFLALLENLTQKYRIPALELIGLPVYLLQRLPSKSFDASGITLFQFDRNALSYLVWDKTGNIIFGSKVAKDGGQSLNTLIGQLQVDFFDSQDIPKISVYSSLTKKAAGDTRVESLSLLMIRSKGGAKRTNKSFYKPKTSGIARMTMTALNSLRLLTFVMAGICFLSLSLAGVMSFLAAGSDENLADYQVYYSEVIQLETILDSLKNREIEIASNLPGRIQAASVISALSQRKFKDVYLTQVSLRRLPSDGAKVEIQGASKQQARIFSYHAALAEQFSPYSLSLNSVKPEVKNIRGIVDTLFVFNFGATINEINRY